MCLTSVFFPCLSHKVIVKKQQGNIGDMLCKFRELYHREVAELWHSVLQCPLLDATHIQTSFSRVITNVREKELGYKKSFYSYPFKNFWRHLWGMFSSFTFTCGQTLANPTLVFYTLDLDAIKGKFTETSSIYSSIAIFNTFNFHRYFRPFFNL